MLLSDTIASFIDQMLNDCGGTLEIKRNDLAKKLGCVPSQINYVVASRFTPERGYLIESRRGGGGYIRIVRREIDADGIVEAAFAAVGDSLTETAMRSTLDTLYAADLITSREKKYDPRLPVGIGAFRTAARDAGRRSRCGIPRLSAGADEIRAQSMCPPPIGFPAKWVYSAKKKCPSARAVKIQTSL